MIHTSMYEIGQNVVNHDPLVLTCRIFINMLDTNREIHFPKINETDDVLFIKPNNRSWASYHIQSSES